MLISNALVTFSLLLASPAAVEPRPSPPVTLDQIYGELRSLRRLVRELLIAARNERLARCDADRERDLLLQAQLDAEEQAATTRLSEIESELSEPEVDASRSTELQEEAQSMRHTVLEPLAERRQNLTDRMEDQQTICHDLQTVAPALEIEN